MTSSSSNAPAIRLHELLRALDLKNISDVRIPIESPIGRRIAEDLLADGPRRIARLPEDLRSRFDGAWMQHWCSRQSWANASATLPDLAHEVARDRANRSLRCEPLTWVVSFPRMGSNHLMALLSDISSLPYRSIYGLGGIGEEGDMVAVRSHALDDGHLSEEVRLLTGRALSTDAPILVLIRDPRDTAISFYEYTRAVLQVDIPQEDFLTRVDYFLASATSIPGLRRFSLEPFSVLDALQRYLASWTHPPSEASIEHIRFEELITDATGTLQRICTVLDVPWTAPSDATVSTPRSRHDSMDRPRGVPQGWRRVADRYKVLIEQVEDALGNQITSLGYDQHPGDEEHTGE